MNITAHLRRLGQKALRNRVVRATIRPFTPITGRADMQRLGTEYGGWWVPTRLLDSQSVVYSLGIGGDASFDLALIENYGCQVWGFDPTPFSVSYVNGRDWPPQWHFEPIGIWIERGLMTFQPLVGHTSGSSSITRPGNSDASFDAPVETLEAVMERIGHSHIDLLKMDIEGAEGPVLDQLLESMVRPTILCVEFDQPELPHRLVHRIRRIISVGYQLTHVELWNYTFVRAVSK